MKIAYLMNPYDSTNIYQYPRGNGYYMIQALIKTGHEVVPVLYNKDLLKWPLRLKSFYYKYLKGKVYHRTRAKSALKLLAKNHKKMIKDIRPDIIFCFGSIQISYLDVDTPKFIFTDAVFPCLLNYYPEFSNLAESTIADAFRAENDSFDRSRLIFFTSEWALQKAIEHFPGNKNKFRLSSIGANIERSPDEAEINRIIASKDFNIVNLLFIGADWQRKGGNKILEIIRLMNRKGIKAKVSIIGASPQIPDADKQFVNLYGYLDKNDEHDFDIFKKTIQQSHFLMLLTEADCTPNSIAEANAYGIPAISNNTGGLKSVIDNGINGQLFDLDSSADAISDYLIKIVSDRQKYHDLALSSYHTFFDKLNWDSVINGILNEIASDKTNS